MHVSPAPSDALVHPTYARLLCVLVRSLGGDLDAVLDQAGLSWEQLSTREQMLDYRVVQALVSTALQVSQQPNLGLALGQMAQLSAH
ncbi:MAG: AraC family transcriptional regulator, partial [Burkholderiaceae bacterium]|nr:AraC family transcriptional regulator [Burkholderiaceae bacterium]